MISTNDDAYYSSHLITYLWNKRRLLHFINNIFFSLHQKYGRKIVSFDGFAGSGVVSRLLKRYSHKVISNDIEWYAETINKAYLSNASEIDFEKVKETIDYLNSKKLEHSKSDYFISQNYAPADDKHIKAWERVFFTSKNARIIDNIRYMIDWLNEGKHKDFALAQLLIKASIHNNTSWVFKWFHKKDGIGHFGGKGENALQRITSDIVLDYPILGTFESDVLVTRWDTNQIVKEIWHVDIAYYDPPYNQHPYWSNYFMLNIINEGKPIAIQDGVSGIAKERYKSEYNKKKNAIIAMDDLIRHTDADYIIISYNNEWIIPYDVFQEICESYGKVTIMTSDYNTYRWSRNLSDRANKVIEILWVIKKTKYKGLKSE